MNIAVVGGGNIGMLLAAELASKGHAVSIVTSNPSRWSSLIRAYDKGERLVYCGELASVTTDVSCIDNACDMVFVTYPSFMLRRAAKMLLPVSRLGLKIGVVPGNGAEFYFAEHIRRGAVLFGLERTHDVARIKEPGKSVYTLGRKAGIQVAALPSGKTHGVADDLRELLGMSTVELPNYLVETLTPSNPILHTSRIRSMFSDWHKGVFYDRNILFYEEWDMASAELLLSCDDELQALCRRLEALLGLDLSGVKSLRDYYESPTPEMMVTKLTSIPAFKGLTSPMKEVAPGSWVPDFGNRYFKADFAFGLKAILDIARIAGEDMPHLKEIFSWYMEAARPSEVFDAAPSSLKELSLIYK